MLDAVRLRGDQYIIERSGKAIAAVVPVEQYEQWRKEREALFALVDEVRSANTGVAQEKVQRDVVAAKRAERGQRREGLG